MTEPKHARQGKLIHDAIMRQGMNPNQFAKQMGFMAASYIYRVTQGKEAVSKPETVARIAALLDISEDDIYIADDRIAPDVLAAIRQYPREMFKLVRLAHQRLQDKTA